MMKLLIVIQMIVRMNMKEAKRIGMMRWRKKLHQKVHTRRDPFELYINAISYFGFQTSSYKLPGSETTAT